jgi:hypothetical protein
MHYEKIIRVLLDWRFAFLLDVSVLCHHVHTLLDLHPNQPTRCQSCRQREWFRSGTDRPTFRDIRPQHRVYLHPSCQLCLYPSPNPRIFVSLTAACGLTANIFWLNSLLFPRGSFTSHLLFSRAYKINTSIPFTCRSHQGKLYRPLSLLVLWLFEA